MAKFNMAEINAVRKDYCEYCGSSASGWPHHIKTRGAGGPDARWNLIQLCARCHDLAQQYKIPRLELVKIVAQREGMDVKEIYRLCGWLYDEKLPHEVAVSNPIAGKTYEEILELYLFCLEKGESSKWEQAALITIMHDYMGMNPRSIASAVGCSASLVRKLTRTFNTFPKDEDRNPVLSFRHHQIAAYSNDPKGWLAKAADNNWSTRQLQEAVKASVNPQVKIDQEWNKAEKALLLIKEVIEVGGDPAEWLLEEIKKITQQVASKVA